MKFSSIDGKFYKFMNTMWTLVKLNFLWILFSLPIVTIGASTVAAFSVTLKMVEEKEGYIFKDFYESFKLNLKQGITLGLVTLFLIYSTYLNIELFNKLEDNPMMFLMLGIFIGLVSLVHLIYAFPLLAKYENSLKNTILNSREIFFKYLLESAIMVIVVAILLVIFSFNFILIFLGILFGPVSIFYTISSIANRVFNKIEKN